MAEYHALGKQVLIRRQHVADAVSNDMAERIADALNQADTMHPDMFSPGPTPIPAHAVRQENDEYACSCGARWDVRDGDDHP